MCGLRKGSLNQKELSTQWNMTEVRARGRRIVVSTGGFTPVREAENPGSGLVFTATLRLLTYGY